MDNNEEKKIRVAITHGDINGVGYEVIIKTFSDNRMFDLCTPVLYGSSKVASYHKKLLTSVTQEMNFNVIHDAADRACEDLKKGKVDVLVTATINKRNIQAPDFDFPGHTEYLSHQFGSSSLMLMVCDRIRIGIVTNHLALKDVPAALTHDLLLEKITLLNQSLKRDFGITRPKIAVLALDPHAGDNGVIGDFDARVIMPVIDEAQANGILAYGPFPSDGFFGSEQFNKFDGVLALYHDQGLIPFKLMSFTEGVNYTAGLPYVRTSPAHGTGYDIAGKDRASEQSFRSAVYLACNILRNRQEYDALNANPLK